MAPTGNAYYVDWIFSNNSNVHVANHRAWFISFTEFKSEVFTGGVSLNQNDKIIKVIGIGDVELNVKTSATRKGNASRRKLILRDVLFAPLSLTNIFGNPISNTTMSSKELRAT
jgi:hypothetical protein